MVLLVIGLAIANIALGFAAAVALRWRWEQLREAWDATAPGQSVLPPAGAVPVPVLSGGQGDSPPTAEATQAASPSDLVAMLGPEAASPQPPLQVSSHLPSTDGALGTSAPATDRPLQPSNTEPRSTSGLAAGSPERGPGLASDASPSAPDATIGPFPAATEGHAADRCWEAGVRALEESSRRYQAQLAAIDEHVRALPPQNTREVLAAAESLRDAGRAYLQEQKEAAPRVCGESMPPDELATLAAQIQAALEAQNAQIEASDHTLAALETASTPEEAHGQCVSASAKLREASGRVSDALESALAHLSAGAELHACPSPDEEPLPAGLISATALEQKIAQWRQDDAQRKRPLALAVLEVDFFEQVAGRYGRDVPNRLLRAVTGILLAQGGGHAVACRSTGPRFAMAFPDADVRLAIHVVERIRQAVERAHFRCHEFDLRVTLSAGITPATPEDRLESLWQRAESALSEARRYGRNRVFVHEGRYPTPIVPPNLDLPEKSIDL